MEFFSAPNHLSTVGWSTSLPLSLGMNAQSEHVISLLFDITDSWKSVSPPEEEFCVFPVQDNKSDFKYDYD